jgi:hypothetical protein
MIWQRVRIALLAGAILAATGSIRAEDEKAPPPKEGEKKDEKKEAHEAHHPGPGPAPGPATCTVWVNEWVPEQYQATRTVYRTEQRTETYTAYRTVSVPEQRTRTVTHYRMVPETVMECRTVCVNVPVCEERTVMKTKTCWKRVTEIERKCEDKGHYECREVPCGPSLRDRLSKHFGHKKDCCADECCEPVRTKTVRVWVPCPTWVEKPVCKLKRVTECYPEVIKVNTCRKEFRTEQVAVTRCRCVPECRTETYTVCVSRCVPYQATRCVSVCVPHQETYTACRMVCRKVAREVTVAPACEPDCCAPACCTPCCDSGCSRRRFCHK